MTCKIWTGKGRKAETASSTEARTYHHGDLRAVMIKTAEDLLRERGVDGFTLRECARRAGVSPAAPAHHFGNMAGLLQAVATVGFEELSRGMEARVEGVSDHAARLTAFAEAYIRVALEQPSRFRVMFQGGVVEARDKPPDLAAASRRAYDLVRAEVETIVGHAPALPETVFVWSFVHGLANLLLDRRLSFLDRTSPSDIDTPDPLPARVIALLGDLVKGIEARRALSL